MKPPVPLNESERLEALRSYRILDTPPERDLDDLVKVAAAICGVPTALISLVDETRQWFKARFGMGEVSTSRDVSFCAHVVGSSAYLEVSDATKDPRFTDNSLVTGAPGIRFYAGTPLTTPEGYVLGTLCVIDYAPKRLNDVQQSALNALARQVMTHLQLRRYATEKARAEAVLLGILEDQTRTEQALRKSEREQRELALRLEAERTRLTQAQAVAKVGSWETDVQTDCVTWSEQTHQIFETDLRTYQPTQAYFFTLVHPADRRRVEEAFRRSLEEPGYHAIEHRILLAGDRVKFVEQRWRTYAAVDGRGPTAIGTCQDITDRRLVEQALREKESLLRIAGKVSRLGGWAVSVPETILFGSDEMFSLLEFAPGSEPSFEGLLSLFSTASRERFTSLLEACVRDMTPFSLEVEMMTAQARRLWVRIAGEADRDALGNVRRIQGAIQDITSVRESELERQRLVGQLATTMESITDALFTLDGSWRVSYFNREAERLLQCDRAAVLGNDFWRQFPAWAGTELEREFRRSLEAAQTLRFEEVAVPGLDAWFEIRCYPSAQGLAVYFRDVTERRKSQAQLRLLENSIARIHDIVIITRADALGQAGSEIVFVNDAFERITGYQRKEVVGRSPAILHGPHTSKETVERIRRKLREGGTAQEELLVYKKDGSEFWIDAYVSPVTDALGQTTHVVSIERDITERRKLEEQFLRAQRMESIGTLAGGIAHDLNNLLTPILMGADLLRQYEVGPDGLMVIANIERSARRGADLVRQVLSFARGVEGARVSVNLAHVVLDVESIAATTFPKSIVFESRLPKDLWSVTGDPTQLNQVLLNLCVNARDAMPQGGKLTITAGNTTVDAPYAAMHRGATTGRYVCIDVSDTGVGMGREVMDRIFEPFFTTKELGLGTGLGLSTVLGIVRSHGGFVNVYSEPGKGSVFKVYLPAPNPDAPEEAAGRPAASLPRGAGELILLVEDEASIREVTRRTLEAFGYRVLVAEDGAQAISLFASRREEVGLIFTDMMMPIMDGPAFIAAVRHIDPEIPIIAASGLNTHKSAVGTGRPGANHFLPKPYTAEAMLAAVNQSLQRLRVEPS